jgi:hypothetical protein
MFAPLMKAKDYKKIIKAFIKAFVLSFAVALCITHWSNFIGVL